nr:zinc finger, CCHC-type [Tanacetum cinerariifolium]
MSQLSSRINHAFLISKGKTQPWKKCRIEEKKETVTPVNPTVNQEEKKRQQSQRSQKQKKACLDRACNDLQQNYTEEITAPIEIKENCEVKGKGLEHFGVKLEDMKDEDETNNLQTVYAQPNFKEFLKSSHEEMKKRRKKKRRSKEQKGTKRSWKLYKTCQTVDSFWKKTSPHNKKDKTAIAFFYQALPEEQFLQITKHKTAKAIWDALKTRHIGEEIVQQARLQTLKSDFEMLHMKEDETIDTFTGKLTTLVNKAASLRHTIEDQTLVRKLLNTVLDRYLQIVASIEQYSDLSEMALEEAFGRLKTYEERIKYKRGKQVDNQEKLMFTRHENKGKYFRRRRRGKHRFSQGRNHENFKEERKDGETSHKNYNRKNFKKSSYDTRKLQCYKCKKIGHISPNCPQRKKPNEQSNLVKEDLEPTLLMAILENSNEEKHVKEDWKKIKIYRLGGNMLKGLIHKYLFNSLIIEDLGSCTKPIKQDLLEDPMLLESYRLQFPS